MESRRAGLAGRWAIAPDGALLIGDRRFTWDAEHQALFSPHAPGGRVGFYILLESARARRRR